MLRKEEATPEPSQLLTCCCSLEALGCAELEEARQSRLRVQRSEGSRLEGNSAAAPRASEGRGLPRED